MKIKKIKETEPVKNFTSRGRFAPGNKLSKGRSGFQKQFINQLRDALLVVEKEKGKTLAQHAIEKAFTNTSVLIAILKKFAPDLAQVKMGTDGTMQVTFNVKDFRGKAEEGEVKTEAGD